MWDLVRSFDFACERVDELQARTGIVELGRIEMFQQMGDHAVGPGVRHRMSMHSQHVQGSVPDRVSG